MLSCSIRFSAPSVRMGGGLESRCVGRVYGADGAVRMAPCSRRKFYIKSKHTFLCSIALLFLEIRAMYEIMWKNTGLL